MGRNQIKLLFMTPIGVYDPFWIIEFLSRCSSWFWDKSTTLCQNFLSLIDCLITPKREERVMGDLDVETFHLHASTVLERAEDELELILIVVKKGKRKVHNHKPQPFLDTKRKRKQTNQNKHKSNKQMKSTKISSLFPKRANHNAKRTEKHKNKMTHGKSYNKSPRRINHKATKSKTNTGTTALERSVE